MVRIGLIQMRCEKAAIDQNLASISGYLEEANALQIEIMGFPEMSISGYADPTRYPEAVLRLDGPEMKRFLEITTIAPRATVLAGLIEANLDSAGNPAGKPFITHIAARNGQLLGSYRKLTIDDEEVEWFSAGEKVPVFQHGWLTFGIAICADIENEMVFAECARQQASIVFELAAPGLYGEQATRNWQSGFEWWRGECRKYLSQYAARYNIWIPVATQAGRTIDEDFPGGGYVFAPGGDCLYETPDGSEGAVYLDLERGKVTVI